MRPGNCLNICFGRSTVCQGKYVSCCALALPLFVLAFFWQRCSQFLCVVPWCTGYVRYADALAAGSINTTLLKV